MLRHNACIIQIFFQHNAIVSEKKCMQILPATRSRMYKVNKGRNVIII